MVPVAVDPQGVRHILLVSDDGTTWRVWEDAETWWTDTDGHVHPLLYSQEDGVRTMTGRDGCHARIQSLEPLREAMRNHLLDPLPDTPLLILPVLWDPDVPSWTRARVRWWRASHLQRAQSDGDALPADMYRVHRIHETHLAWIPAFVSHLTATS